MKLFWVLALVGGVLFPTRAAFPNITSFAPKVGAPGTVVTILGTDFGFVTRVTIGGADAAISGRTPLTVVVPVAGRTGPIYVYNATGFDDSNDFFQVAPRITGFGPVAGAPDSGLEVTVDGFNFSNPGSDVPPVVRFNGVPSPSVFVVTDLPGGAQLRAVLPPTATTGPISVTTLAGTATTPANFHLPPVLSRLDPARAAVGDKIKVIGRSMTGVTDVWFGGIPATFSVQSPTNLLVTVPAGTTNSALVVANPFFLSTPLVFLVLPRIAAIEPDHADVGSAVALVGSGLTSVQSVSFAGKAATVLSNPSPAAVYVRVPSGVGTGPVTVVTAQGTNTSTALFYGVPRITSLTPTRGEPGTTVTVAGENFLGTTNVFLGDLGVEIVSITNAQVRFRVPQGAVSGTVRVEAPGGRAVSSGAFSVVGSEPVVGGFSPDYGPVGTEVQVTGSKLTGATVVTFNDVPAVPVVKNDGLLTVTVPLRATSGRIRVTTPGGTASSSRDFLVGDSADLAAILTATPDPVAPGAEVLFRFEVRNAGPLPALRTGANLGFTDNLTFVSHDASEGTVDRFGATINWSLGTVTAGRTATLLVRMKAPPAGTVRATAEVRSDLTDKFPDNNDDQASVRVVAQPPPRLGIGISPDGVIELSWASDGSDVLLEETRGFSPPSWAVFGTAPVSEGGTSRVVVPAPSSTAFFRLRRR